MDKINAIANSLPFRTLFVTLLIAVMLIPLLMTQKIINERNQYYHQNIDNISKGWGKQQTIIGPVLVVPYVEHIFSAETIIDKEGISRTISRDIFKNKTRIVLPEILNIEANLKEQHRKRGIYNALLYIADITLSGKFDLSTLPPIDSKNRKVKWEKAYLAVGLSDTKAITEASPIHWDKASTVLEPGSELVSFLKSGVHASMKTTRRFNSHPNFKIKLSLKGSDGFLFAPLGKVTTAKITSGWPHPSFQGDLLPSHPAEINEKGFKATWSIPNLARNYPQTWLLEEGKQTPQYDLYSLTTGVSLFTPLSIYKKIDRVINYGALFIGLTFVVFLLFEIISNIRISITQYLLIGISLSLFYLILLSLSEYLDFLRAYAYAATTTVVLITLYTIAVLKSVLRALMVFLLLSGLYSVLFVILEQQDYALLAGTSLIILVVMAMMIATRHLPKQN